MATLYSCAGCGTDMDELAGAQVCVACVEKTYKEHTIKLQFQERPLKEGFRYRAKCQCGQYSAWFKVAGVAHGWQESHVRDMVWRLHDDAFNV